jgi:hypothetical protein
MSSAAVPALEVVTLPIRDQVVAPGRRAESSTRAPPTGAPSPARVSATVSLGVAP